MATRTRQGATRGRAAGAGGATAVPRGSAQERFDRRVTSRRRRTWKLFGVLVLLAAIAAGGWWVLWRSDWLLVEEVVVTGTEERWHDSILDAAAIVTSQPMVEVDADGAEERVAEVSIVRDVQVLRSWPRTMTIKVTPREPVLGVRQDSGSIDLVDDLGVTIETVSAPPEGTPVVVAQGAAGATAEAYQAAWSVLVALPETIAEQAEVITVTSARMVTLDLGERTLVWGGPEDAELKAQVAEALLATDALRIDVSAPRTPVTEGVIEAADAEGE